MCPPPLFRKNVGGEKEHSARTKSLQLQRLETVCKNHPADGRRHGGSATSRLCVASMIQPVGCSVQACQKQKPMKLPFPDIMGPWCCRRATKNNQS